MLTDWSNFFLHLEFILPSAVNKSLRQKFGDVISFVVILLLVLRFS